MPVPLRSDVDSAALRGIARRSKDGPHIDEWRRLTLERFQASNHPAAVVAANLGAAGARGIGASSSPSVTRPGASGGGRCAPLRQPDEAERVSGGRAYRGS
jgi:hypothetical protein